MELHGDANAGHRHSRMAGQDGGSEAEREREEDEDEEEEEGVSVTQQKGGRGGPLQSVVGLTSFPSKLHRGAAGRPWIWSTAAHTHTHTR